ncbi:alpha/beta hydrolase [Phormidium tenue FACHB-886]|nr:alpha/beta hydrolase [Phormidium tenue FACHB-886]
MIESDFSPLRPTALNSFWQQHFLQGCQTLTIPDAQGRSVKIAYGEVGSGQPLLLLHGIGSWSYNWRFNIQPLSQFFRVICVDAKGYGFSKASPLPETVGHQVIELTRIIQALSDMPVLIAAESLGALTALAVAQQQPQLIDRLVVINVPIFPKRLPSWGMRSLVYLPLSLVQLVDRGQLLRWVAPVVRQIAYWVRREVVADASLITAEEIDSLTEPYLYRSGCLTQFAADLKLGAEEIKRLQRNQPNWISQIQQQLHRISCPTLVLWADQDQWFPATDGEILSSRLRHSQLQVIPSCGHIASSGNPKAVNAAILSFLRQELPQAI